MAGSAITIAAFLALSACLAHADDKRRDRDERALRSLEARARRLPSPPAQDEIGTFLMTETARLIGRLHSLPAQSYESRRIREALDDLLDAREDLSDLHRRGGDKEDKHDRGDTAKRLERVYFRVQQGEYFGRLSGDPHAPDYIRRARQLYQQARSAWDARRYREAEKLASASSELVNVLENLAQAVVRKPDPPVLR